MHRGHPGADGAFAGIAAGRAVIQLGNLGVAVAAIKTEPPLPPLWRAIVHPGHVWVVIAAETADGEVLQAAAVKDWITERSRGRSR